MLIIRTLSPVTDHVVVPCMEGESSMYSSGLRDVELELVPAILGLDEHKATACRINLLRNKAAGIPLLNERPILEHPPLQAERKATPGKM
eukprot:jgi/Bigna1/64269/fgenesh1_kg.71_\